MGSDSDYTVLQAAEDYFESMGVAYDIRVSSAHRSPARTETLVRESEEAGV